MKRNTHVSMLIIHGDIFPRRHRFQYIFRTSYRVFVRHKRHRMIDGSNQRKLNITLCTICGKWGVFHDLFLIWQSRIDYSATANSCRKLVSVNRIIEIKFHIGSNQSFKSSRKSYKLNLICDFRGFLYFRSSISIRFKNVCMNSWYSY